MHDCYHFDWSDEWDRGDTETQRIAEYIWQNSHRLRWKDRDYPCRIFRAGDRFARQILEDTPVILFSESREVKRFTRAEFIARYLDPTQRPSST
jgi:hypothetical protein